MAEPIFSRLLTGGWSRMYVHFFPAWNWGNAQKGF